MLRVGAGAEFTQVAFDGARKFNIPTTLRVHRPAVDAPLHAILRFRWGSQWEFCSYQLELEQRKTYQRLECTTGALTSLSLVEARLEAVMSGGDGLLEAALAEPLPCASSPRSVDGLTVIQGGRFFPGTKPKDHWVAVMDEAVVAEELVDWTAQQLANEFGVDLGLITHGPYGFEFRSSSSRAQALALDSRIRFVEAMVEYRGAGWSEDKIPVPGSPTSWALDRLDQREANAELTLFAAGDEGKDHRFRYPETAAPLNTRPRLFVVDTRARTSHSVFTALPAALPLSVPGASPQCTPGGGNLNSHHGTSVLSSALGRAGTLRLPPRETLVVEGLGLRGFYCDSADELQVVEALRQVAIRATARDLVVLSFGSDRLGMMTEMSVNGLVRNGVIVLAATGNEGRASLYPPAGAAEALAVGATEDLGLDNKWANSNGLASSVDFHAPGVAIETASDSSDTATMVANGTSLSAPFVAGIAAYHVMNGGLSGTPDQLRGLVKDALVGTSRTRTATQLALPFTPTQPLFGTPQAVASTMLLANLANDGESAWLAGLHSGSSGASLVRIPLVGNEPSVAGAQLLRSGVGSRCLSVVATADGATTGCWSESVGGRLSIYQLNGGTATEVAAIDVVGVPVAVAADVEPSTTTFANTNVRAALSLPVLGMVGPNPHLGTTMRLTIARRSGSGWSTSSLDFPGDYQSSSKLALNCPRLEFQQGSSCDAFALLTHDNNMSVRLYKVTFDESPGFPISAPTLIAERVDSGPFLNCFIPGWATGVGLVATSLAVDDVNLGGIAASRWSFAFNRGGSSYINGQCAFDHTSIGVNDASPMLDVVGPRGEYWVMTSRGAWSRTTLAVTSVWNPVSNTVETGLRSAIRSLHPRGGAIIDTNIRAIAHSTYGNDVLGNDAVAVSSADGVTWSIMSVKP
ncbi:MAG: S8 family serine peptidase [Myxococcus sp.]|nr:S8 family serine peptidase [Myxococcus sp.]